MIIKSFMTTRLRLHLIWLFEMILKYVYVDRFDYPESDSTVLSYVSFDTVLRLSDSTLDVVSFRQSKGITAGLVQLLA